MADDRGPTALDQLPCVDADGIRTITFNRPEAKNAMSMAMRARFCELLSDAEQASDIRAVIVTAVDPVFTAGVDFHGVHAMVRPIENNLSPDAQAAAHQLQWTSSPMGAIGTWRSPVLLIHGDDDKNVDFSQSVLLARELAARRIPYRDLVFPNERHGFLRYADWLASYRAADDFLRETLLHKQIDEKSGRTGTGVAIQNRNGTKPGS